jgi:hypothetical protein
MVFLGGQRSGDVEMGEKVVRSLGIFFLIKGSKGVIIGKLIYCFVILILIWKRRRMGNGGWGWGR